jgi:PIN domain nuclease of toxin-antitoxin system
MNFLLDTLTFLWFINDDASLSSTAKALIEDPENTIYLSVASVWEMAIKVSLDKLEMPSPFADFIDEQLSKNTIILLGIKTAHAGVVATLPFRHRDPFDRLIIAQSKSEDFSIIGKDVIFDDYGIKRHW